ncbi:preprotein translocase subunit SecE [Pseudoalteromonas sp. 13-15]|jgi:preprotein translocase subunit SecE|uniref:Protein translocase subunit SecE n=1 Tax=Pseudoalteromonas marina TaxID=267375 RepID=A0ABT9FFR2_9GAMM|nr:MULTISPECIES: preprotein translocase subunit SecE [Pseudoalteromonas]EAW29438.1 preprotein translocase, membrane component, transport across inner membrane (General Secretory Pathway) [Alteromonadales bacterium TW-7]MBL1384746.1 preprotein translocase subunit SecE [Colwellia sp.]ATG56960.1 preprotein translocase subunit SecE [Pseudoalteromonas marina]AUL73937.1 preprotein translocase subunit SecE [Pseudoalteromonas sp. 13-15]KAF7777307.1 preprotein translocase subunit SecE [Pseudoalteromona|tara:strand:- start:324 stop:701 length:378 start_codon:yes stop_codon:yes gene_type:complete
MSTNVETPSSGMESVKWLVAIALLAGAVVGNHMYADQSVLLRAIGVVVAIAAGLAIASQTFKGRTFLAFAKEARIEVRKVIWPTRQETTHTTLIVMVATVIMALILWGLDGILFRAVGFLTGLEI